MMTARLILCVFTALPNSRPTWFPHCFSFCGETMYQEQTLTFYLNFVWHQRRKAGPSLPTAEKPQRKIAPSASLFLGMDHPPLFSPGGRRLLLQAFHSQWEQRQRETWEWEEENGEHEPAQEPQLRHQSGSVPAHPGQLSDPADTGKIFIFAFFKWGGWGFSWYDDDMFSRELWKWLKPYIYQVTS